MIADRLSAVKSHWDPHEKPGVPQDSPLKNLSICAMIALVRVEEVYPMSAQLIDQIKEYGYKARIVPISHLRDLDEAIRVRYEQGLLDQEL